MKPPECRQCGVAEWRHLCRGAPKLDMKPRAKAKFKNAGKPAIRSKPIAEKEANVK